MKRKLSLIITLVMIIGLFAGCRKEEPIPPVSASTPFPVQDVTDEPVVTEEPTAAVTPAEEEPHDEASLLAAFLKGSETAAGLSDISDIFTPGMRYSISSIADILLSDCIDMYGETRYLSSLNYSMIDCGNDGIPDLALEFTFDDSEGWMAAYIETLVFTCVDGIVYCAGMLDTYERWYSFLNRYGYAFTSGSSAANISTCSEYYFDEYGYKHLIESEDEYMGLAEIKLPMEYLPTDSLVKPASTEEMGNPGYTLSITAFSEFDVSNESNIDWTSAVNEYLRTSVYYTFYDEEGNCVMPDDDYLATCEADGLNVISSESLEELLNARIASLGMTKDMIKDLSELEWTAVPESSYLPQG